MNRTALWSIFVVACLIGLTACGGSNSSNNVINNPPPPVIAITVSSGASQTATVGTAFSAQLVATVTSNGSPASGMTVTFTAPANGASGTFGNGQTSETDQTDANGKATSTTFKANATAGGPYNVTASVSGAASPATFGMTNVAPLAYSFYLSGLEVANLHNGKNFYSLAGAVTMDLNGNILGGEQDFNDANGLTSPQPQGDSITGGTLTVGANGQGTLTLHTNNANLGVGGVETLGVQFVNTNHALLIQFDGSATSSGSLDTQTLSSAPTGGFAFTLSGVDPSYHPVVAGGVFTVSGTNLQNGLADTDDAGTVATATAFSGAFSAADSFGRGSVSGVSLAGNAVTLNYYIVGPEVIRIIDVDVNDSAIGSAFGQGSATFTNGSLAASVVGVEANSFETPFAMAGMFTTNSGAGTFTGVADNDEDGNVINSAAAISGNYSVSPTISGTTYNGYGSLTITPGNLGHVSAMGVYLTDPSLNLSDPNNKTNGQGGGLVVDLDASLGGSGILIPQTDTNPADVTGNYSFGGREYNADTLDEFDFVGLGSINTGVLSGTGMVSDPGQFFSTTAADSGVTFAGTATADAVNVGRFTMPVTVTVSGVNPVNLNVVLYQASGGQLIWLDEDANGLFVGPLQQQGSLTGLAARKAAAKASVRRK